MDERSISDPHSIAVLLYKQSLIEAQAGNSDEAMSFYRQAKRLWSEIDSQLTRIEAEFKQEQLEPEPKRKQVDRSGGACWILDVPISVWIGHLSGLLDLPTLAYFSRTCRPLAQILTADGTWRELCRRDPRFTKGMIPSKQHYFSCTRPRSDGLYISRNSYTRRVRPMGNVHIADAEDRRNYIDGKVVETVYYRCLFLIPNTSVCLHLRTTSSPSVCLEAIQQKLQEISRAGRLPMYTFDQPIPEPRVAGRQNRAVEYPTRKTPVEQTTENVCVGHWEHSADRVQLTICDPQVPGQTVLLHRVVLRLSNVTSKQRWVPSGRMSIVEFESNGVAHDVSDTRHFNCFRFSSVFEWRHLQWNRNSFF